MTTIIDLFRENVARYGGRCCFKFKSEGVWQEMSWKDAGDKVSKYAAYLSSLGITHGDRVGIMSATRYEWTLADMAVLSLGAVTVPVYPSLPAEHIAYILGETSPKALFVENEQMSRRISLVRNRVSSLRHIMVFDAFQTGDPSVVQLEKIEGKPLTVWPEVLPKDTASIIYTSGTTGMQKGVVITHANIVAEVRALQNGFAIDREDTLFAFLPLAHVLARAIQFYQLSHGCKMAFAESIKVIPENLLEVRPEMVVVVPRFLEKIHEKIMAKVNRPPRFKKWLFKWCVSAGMEYGKRKRRKEPVSLILKSKRWLAQILLFSKIQEGLGGRIKFIVTGGAPFSEELGKFFHAVGIHITEGYGLTETMAAVTVNRLDDFHLGTVGKPLSNVEVKLSDDDEILIKGGMVFKEYLNRPEETKRAFTPDGWFKTGDIGEFSRDGFLRITDRKKDLIITSGGKNVSPQMIETLLLESKYINHVMIIGERRRYLSAIVTINKEAVSQYADERGIRYQNIAELIEHADIRRLIETVIEEKNTKLANFETIKKFAILDHEFTVETGELTPTMKVKRRLIEEKYRELVESLYK